MPAPGVGQQYSTGAVYIFAAPPTSGGGFGQPLWLGTCEKMPQDQRQPEYEMLMNDVSGTKVPYDLSWQGMTAQISLVMTITVQSTVELMLASPRPVGNVNGAVSTPGTWDFSDVGALMMLEGLGWTVWLAYTFGSALSNKPAYASGFPNALRPGRRYYQCILWTPQLEETGTAPMKTHLMLFSWPFANLASKTFTLYDYDLTGINSSLIQ